MRLTTDRENEGRYLVKWDPSQRANNPNFDNIETLDVGMDGALSIHKKDVEALLALNPEMKLSINIK